MYSPWHAADDSIPIACRESSRCKTYAFNVAPVQPTQYQFAPFRQSKRYKVTDKQYQLVDELIDRMDLMKADYGVDENGERHALLMAVFVHKLD